MAEENKPVEVDQPVQTSGKVQFMTAAGFSNPPPVKLKRVLAALKYFSVSLITLVSATDLFSGRQSKIINFVLGLTILAMGAIELATGVKPVEDDNK